MNTANEDGYTLIETLVAMAIFLSVLIPVGVTIGNFMLDGSASRITLAVQAGQSEISRVIAEHDFVNGTRKDDRGFSIERTVKISGNLLEIQINVISMKQPGRSILTLH